MYKRIKPKSKEVFKSARKEGERKTRKRESKKRIVTPLVSAALESGTEAGIFGTVPFFCSGCDYRAERS